MPMQALDVWQTSVLCRPWLSPDCRQPEVICGTRTLLPQVFEFVVTVDEGGRFDFLVVWSLDCDGGHT